nr:hypothetical protein [Tanacetum cinerariifolium]
MALPLRDQRHPYLRFEGLEYTKVDIAKFEDRLGKIYGREIHQRYGCWFGQHPLSFSKVFKDIFFREEAQGDDIWRAVCARLAKHFGLLTEQRLQGLTAWVASRPDRQPDATNCAPKVAEGDPDIVEDLKLIMKVKCPGTLKASQKTVE